MKFESGLIAKINITAIKNNVRNLKKKMCNNQKFCMVLKANAYGFGSKKICENLSDFVDYFAVSSAFEFYQIRLKTTKPILILDPVYSCLEKLIKSEAEVTVSNMQNCYDLIKICAKLGVKAKVHIAFNTGMNRFGFSRENEVIKAIMLLKKSQNISICGVFSHYFDANNKNNANLQYNKFVKLKRKISHLMSDDCIFHLCATDGLFNKNCFDMVRIGMGCYSDINYETITLYSHIIDLKVIKKNEHIGYGTVVSNSCKKIIAIVGVGYGDGLPRNIVKNGYVLINDNYCKILNICMDSTLVDVTKTEAKIGDKVTLIGKDKTNKIFICDLANWCDTIDYDIVIKLTNRVKRKYLIGERKCKSSQESIGQENLLLFKRKQQDQHLQE